MSKRPTISKLAPRGLLSGLRQVSSRLPESILIHHFVASLRIIVLGLLVFTAILVARLMFADPVIDNSEAHFVKLETHQLERVMSAVKARRQEFPETVVGNRREYFTTRR